MVCVCWAGQAQEADRRAGPPQEKARRPQGGGREGGQMQRMFPNGSACRRLRRCKLSGTKKRSSAQIRAPRQRRQRKRLPNAARLPSATGLESLRTLRQQVRNVVKLELRAILDRDPSWTACSKSCILPEQHDMARRNSNVLSCTAWSWRQGQTCPTSPVSCMRRQKRLVMMCEPKDASESRGESFRVLGFRG